MNKKILVRQRNSTDCGAACLLSVAAFYNLKVPIIKIRKLASSDQKGTNVMGIVEAADKLGFSAKAVKGQMSSLPKIPIPAIAHLHREDGMLHFVVIYKNEKNKIRYMDPETGKMHNVSHEEFLKTWTGVVILIAPNISLEKTQTPSLFRRFMFILAPHKDVLIQALIGTAIFTILGLSLSIYVQKIVDYVLPEANKNLMNLLSVMLIVILGLQFLLGYIRSIFLLKISLSLNNQLNTSFYRYLIQLPQKFFDVTPVGDLMSRLEDVSKIRSFVYELAINVAINLFVILFSFGLMFTYHWKLALLMLLIIPIYALIYVIVDKMNDSNQRKHLENVVGQRSHLVETLNSISTIKKLGLETFMNFRMEGHVVRLTETGETQTRNIIFSTFATDFSAKFFTILMLWPGAYWVIDGTLSAGELLSFYSVLGYFTLPASNLINSNRAVRESLLAAERLFEIADIQTEYGDDKVEFTNELAGNIEFKNVDFRYGARLKIFEKLNIVIPKGKITALIGESGSGKTTLAALLQNIYQPQSGAIMIGGYDLQMFSPDSLRKHISIVPQKIELFAGTVLENITAGDFDPDMKRVFEIAQKLEINKFVDLLPQGYNTSLKENGEGLSGGQKQLIAVARTLYKESEIIVFDEASSALDAVNEKRLLQIIQELKSDDKTIILITHRISSARYADQIIVLHDGKAIEQGTHESLIEMPDTKYSQLWQNQYKIF